MNILYITNFMEIAAASGGYINDYQNDLLFYGLRELFGDNVVDSTQIIPLYKEYEGRVDPRNIWGGMTSMWLIGENQIDRSYIPEKIMDRFYDVIIYGAIKRCGDYYDLVSAVYPPERVILIDGNDEPDLMPLYWRHPYFKRELQTSHSNLHPISFGFPTSKIAVPSKNKQKMFATCVPGKKETYIFNDEKSYYEDYMNSYYGITMKKAGWDCMRHYEIMGNYCIPWFEDIEQCPIETLANFPKDLLIEAKNLQKSFDETKYYAILDEIFLHFKKHLTTKAMAEYVLSKI